MDERHRLLELEAYSVLDTLPEKELDEIAEIATAICDTPVALITLVNNQHHWYMAQKGIDELETACEYAFCQHIIPHPEEVLVIDNPLHDERFGSNPMVVGASRIRFYAGAPLVNPAGQVMGTLCVVDDKPRSISENQKGALRLLAKRVIGYLETRKLLIQQDDHLELSASRLKKLSDQAPGAIFQFEMTPNGRQAFTFVSKGITEIHPSLSPEKLKENPEAAFSVIHPEDVASFRGSIYASYLAMTPWSNECRVVSEDGSISWCWGNAKPEKEEDGTVIWYGTLQNITEKKVYTKTLERVLFDISHTIRRPVATMLGLTAIIEQGNLDDKTLREFVGHLDTVSQEMDVHIRQLNKTYLEVQAKFSRSGEVQNV